MHFPFDQRWGLAYWDAVFADKTPFVPNPQKDAIWNRGAYLVQGLGHCGACHTPRGIGFQELAMSDLGSKGKLFLSGAQVEHWNAVALRDLWTVPDTVEMLKTGQNRFATASGSMTDVILHSTQHVSDPDLVAIATYLKSLPSDAPRSAAPAPPRRQRHRVAGPALHQRGGLGYTQFCTDCHRPTGGGVKGVFPALAGNPTVAAKDPATLIHITLTGWKTASTGAHPRVYTMPGFARLSDAEIAEILSFVRRAGARAPARWRPRWPSAQAPGPEGRQAPSRHRACPGCWPSRMPSSWCGACGSMPRPTPAAQERGQRPELHLLPPECGHRGRWLALRGVSAFFPSYAPRAGKVITMEDRINGCFRRSMNGKPLPPDSDDMKAMVAYFDWMKGNTKKEDKVPGRGVGKVDPKIVPNVANGEGLWRPMRRLPRPERRRPEGRGRPHRLPAAVGRALLQHRRRHGPHLHRGSLRQAQHAHRLPREVPAGPGRPVGPGRGGRGRVLHPPGPARLPRQGQGLAEGPQAQGRALLSACENSVRPLRPRPVRPVPAVRGRPARASVPPCCASSSLLS
jgi:thiosulfate dehydrogenase